MMTLFGFSFAFAAIAAAAFGAWSVLVTHRICGPLGVVQRGLEQIGRGELPRFRPLRRRDEFRDFYAAYWRMVHALRSKRQSRAAALQAILAAAESSARAGDAAARAGYEKIVELVHPLLKETQPDGPARSALRRTAAAKAEIS